MSGPLDYLPSFVADALLGMLVAGAVIGVVITLLVIWWLT